jgi:O-antigen/teichoic acid export membrane protein
MIFVMPIQNLLILEGKTGAAMWSMILFAVIDVAILPTAAWLNPTTLGILHGIILAASLKVVMVLFHVYSTYFTKEILANCSLR